jgi:hypothetical protein
MKTIQMLFLSGFLLAQNSTHAESPVDEVPTPAEQLPTSVQNAASSTTSVLAEHELPKLLVIWDCGKCVPNDKVPPLIEKEYADYASAHGYTVSQSETANMVISKYHQRPPAARAMLGAFSGRDTLTTNVAFRDDKFVATDYNANAWFGMNDLCRSVAQKSAEHIGAKLRGK